MSKKYTEEDILFLKEIYPTGNWKAIFDRFPDSTRCGIHCIASKYGIKSKEKTSTAARSKNLQCKKWTANEIDILKRNYSIKSMDEIEKLLPDRNKNSIVLKANSLGIQSFVKLQSRWNLEEVQYIVDHWKFESDYKMSLATKHTEIAVRCKRTELGLLRWNGTHNYEDLSKYIRGNIYEWKAKSMEACNYQCIITGRKDFEIHHLYSVSDILNDVVEKIGFRLKESFDEYTESELNEVLKHFILEQNKHPLGVCICTDIHKLFHSIYGRGHNTVEQFEEFLNNNDFEKYKNVA